MDRRAVVVLALACLFVYGWFYQGPGYNQHSHFATVRALVEHGRFEISPYADTTGDVGRIDGRVYSNKASGLALLSVGPYFALYHVERLAGFDPADARVAVFNLYLLTFWASALPATGCVVALYVHLRRHRQLAPHVAMLLAGAYAFGTLGFLLSGMMMAHNFVALCLLLAWLLLLEQRTPRVLLAVGALVTLAVLSEHLAGPVAIVYLLAVLAGRPSVRQLAAFCAVPVAGVAFILCYNAAVFGELFTTNYAYTDWSYRSPELLMGVLDWPSLRKLYWITIHPHRGLFYACPVLALALLVTVREPRWRGILRRHLVPLGVIAYFVLFNISFYGWTGGWGVGPRYLMPAIPFMFILATYAALRWPRLATVLAVVSISNMFTVAAVCVSVPSTDYGPPVSLDPIVECYRRLYGWGTIAMHHGSFNLGQRLGLPGLTSLIPPLGAMALCAWAALVWLRPRRAAAVGATEPEMGSFRTIGQTVKPRQVR